MLPRIRLGPREWLVGIVVVAALAMLVVPAALRLPVAVGHAQFHALFALALLAPAAAIAWRSRIRPTIASTAPILGFVLFGVAQIVEALGGLGFGPDNDSRVNELAAVHDLGLQLTPIGLVGAVLGATIGLGVLIGRATGRRVAGFAAALVVLLVGGFTIAKLIGI